MLSNVALIPPQSVVTTTLENAPGHDARFTVKASDVIFPLFKTAGMVVDVVKLRPVVLNSCAPMMLRFVMPLFLTIALAVVVPPDVLAPVYTWSIAIEAPLQLTAMVVLFVTVAVVVLVSVENHPAISVAMATVNAISRTAAISGEIPFIKSLFLYVRKQYIKLTNGSAMLSLTIVKLAVSVQQLRYVTLLSGSLS